MSQLRADLTVAFDSAKDRIESCALGSGDLLEAVRRLILGPMRFIEPNPTIQDAQAAMAAKIKVLQSVPQPRSDVEAKYASRVRREACDALIDLRHAVFEHGCASTAADRGGLGVQGMRI